jgi:hypothetical protein
MALDTLSNWTTSIPDIPTTFTENPWSHGQIASWEGYLNTRSSLTRAGIAPAMKETWQDYNETKYAHLVIHCGQKNYVHGDI